MKFFMFTTMIKYDPNKSLSQNAKIEFDNLEDKFTPWFRQGKCFGSPADDKWLKVEPSRKLLEEMRKICREDCSVRTQCLNYAIKH